MVNLVVNFNKVQNRRAPKCNDELCLGYMAEIKTKQLILPTCAATIRSINNWIIVQELVVADFPFNWDRPWNDYKEGFGSLGSNYWIGLER